MYPHASAINKADWVSFAEPAAFANRAFRLPGSLCAPSAKFSTTLAAARRSCFARSRSLRARRGRTGESAPTNSSATSWAMSFPIDRAPFRMHCRSGTSDVAYTPTPATPVRPRPRPYAPVLRPRPYGPGPTATALRPRSYGHGPTATVLRPPPYGPGPRPPPYGHRPRRHCLAPLDPPC